MSSGNAPPDPFKFASNYSFRYCSRDLFDILLQCKSFNILEYLVVVVMAN
jgi:hypothetical protein